MKRLTVIVPVINEAKNVTSLASRIHAALKSAEIEYDIVFVDDHSTDETVTILQKLQAEYPIKVQTKVGKPGKAYSILEGAKSSTSEFIAMIDGDLQYPPELLPEMYDAAVTHGVAVGNRTKRHTNFIRKFVSKSYRYLFGKVLMGMDVDVQSGIKVFRREIITHLTEKDVTPWTLDMPLLHTARELGYNAVSVDMEFLDRVNGQSNINVMRASTEIGIRALKLRLAKRKIYRIVSDGDNMMGAGLAYKKRRYITHTKLHHKDSAILTVTRGQKVVIASIVAAIVYGIVSNPFATALAFTAVLSLIYFIDVLFSGYVLLKSLHFPPEIVVGDEQLSRINEDDLPVYSVLCPLYKEAHILPQFVEAMETLDWPKKKLEVLLLLEEDDTKTIETARAMSLPSHFTIVVVPHSFPKSKPKACNYGLSVATGEYVVIYDAEDKPDPLQLKKVYLSFLKLGNKYGCIQCKLNYFNSTDNLLTRLFTAEYSLWFDIILPGLQSIDGIIPLGGTSNHFRRDDLISLNGWDPFNVTEDADLGMRLFKNGYKTAIVDSTTLEESNSRVWNWIRQRSRWIKGYFQTYLVHMRNPVELFRKLGFQALVFQLVIGMRMTFMLINPILWLITVAYFAAYSVVGPTIESLFPPLVFYMAGFALVIGNFMYLYNYMIGCAKRGHWGLIKFVLFVPVYWLLTSVAAGMALWQLITKPHYWEKTNHGLNTANKKKVEIDESIVVDSPASTSFKQPTSSSIVTGGAILITASMIANLLNFIYSAYIGKSVGFAEIGLLSLFSSLVNLAQIPLSTFSRAVTHKAAQLYGRYGSPVRPFWVIQSGKIFIPTIITTILWVVSIPFLMPFFQSSDMLPFIFITPVWATGIAAAVDSGYLSGSHKFAIGALMTIVEASTKLGLTILFVHGAHGDLLYTAIPASLVASFVVGRIAILLSRGQVMKIAETELRSVSKRFMGSTFLTKLASIVFLSVDVVLAKHFLPPEEAGKYALISVVGKMVYFLGTLFTQFVNPLVSRNIGAGKSSKHVFRIIMPLTALATLGGFVVFGLAAPITLPPLLGTKIFEVMPYLIPYTFAMAAITLAGGIVNFHQTREKHSFAVISLLSSLYMIVLINISHASIGAISTGVVISGLSYFAITFLAHLFTNHDDDLSEKPTRILIFNWRDTKHKWAGGAEVYVHELAKTWVNEGRDVTLFCGNDKKNLHKETIDGVKIIRKGGHYTVYFWAAVYYIFSLGNKCDVIVESINGIPFFTPFYSNKRTFLLVYHVHQNIFREHLKFPLSVFAMCIEKYLMPLVYRGGRVITISDSTKSDLITLGLTEADAIEIVNPGVDFSHYRTLAKTKYPSFIYVGRLKHYKNVDVALNAFAKVLVTFPKAIFTIAGSGEMLPELKILTHRLGIEKSVRFAGQIDEYEKAALLAKSWIALQPSSVEGWGITVIEANAAGTPVIASSVSGLKDSVVDSVTGILVEAKNVEAWSEAMVGLIRNEKRRLKLSSEAKKWSVRFSWQNAGITFLTKLEQKLLI